MPKLGVINGLRGFAILAVIYHHVFSKFTGPGYGSFELANITFLPFTYLSNGWLGVNIFFVLSGFVLSYPYFLKKRDFISIEDIKRYYLHRAKRLLPLYYFSIFFCVIFISHSTSIISFFKEIFLLVTVLFVYSSEFFFPSYNWVLWALGIIIWFSIIFPLLIIITRKYSIKNVLLVVLIVSLVVRIIGNSEIFYIGNPVLNPVKDSLFGRLDEFVWGMFLCHIYVNKVELISKIQAGAIFIGGIILITVSCSIWDYIRLDMLTGSMVPFANIILDLGFVMLTLSLLAMKENPIKLFFSNYILQLFGIMSYSLYVWHGIAISHIITKYDAAHVILYFLILFVLSCLSYRFIEFGYIANTKNLFLISNK